MLATSSTYQLLKRCPVFFSIFSFWFSLPSQLVTPQHLVTLAHDRTKTRWLTFLTSISQFFLSRKKKFWVFLLLACKLVRNNLKKQRNSCYCYFIIIVIISHRNCAWKSIPAVIFAIIVLLLRRNCFVILFYLSFFFSFFQIGLGMCFFPTEFQGEYMTQSSSRGGVNLQYAPISILPESIPVWGVCHRRFGNRVILMDR